MSYKSHALKIGSSWIGGILKQSATNTPGIQASPTAGSIYPLQVSINEVKNGFSFSTYNVATALGLLGVGGLALGGGTSAELYEILWTNAGQIASGSVHRKLVFANGRVVPRRLAASHRQDCTLDLDVMGISSDGAASPLAITESVALPTAVDDARHTLLSALVADISMGCIQNLEFDFGIGIESAGCNSNVFDTRIQINQIVPKITITTLDANLVGTGGSQFPITGKACTHADTLFYLRKRIPKTATFVADATAEHISITADGICLPTQMFDGSNNDDGSTTFEITGTYDGTNLPFVIDTTAAIE